MLLKKSTRSFIRKKIMAKRIYSELARVKAFLKKWNLALKLNNHTQYILEDVETPVVKPDDNSRKVKRLKDSYDRPLGNSNSICC